ncbi:MAG TPA: tyrosine--tRNA ligase [Drouetiella sp.]
MTHESDDVIPEDIMEEAHELCRGTEVLPEGAKGLAKRIKMCRDQKRPMRVKLGVDPTHTDLHIGHAVIFRKLRRFQDFGHQVVLIIGGFTAQIGDPTGRNSTRPPLTAEQTKENAQTYLNQIGRILDLEKTEVTNNADWLAPMNLSDMLKLAGKVTANQLLAKEAFGDRIEKQLPVYFHELFYPLLQGYDSIAIKADIELGGTDQRFNILMGRELQPHFKLDAQLAMFLPLLEGTDGEKKMSKSYNNYIGLNEGPDDMFGKCMRIPDTLLIKYYEMTTSLTGREIDAIKAELDAGGNPKDAKEKLAEQIVRQYHGEEAAKQATSTWQRVHSQKQVPDDVPLHTVSEPTPLFRILVDAKLVSGTGEGKRLCQEGGVRVDGEQVKDPMTEISVPAGDGIVVQVGRRKFARLKSE